MQANPLFRSQSQFCHDGVINQANYPTEFFRIFFIRNLLKNYVIIRAPRRSLANLMGESPITEGEAIPNSSLLLERRSLVSQLFCRKLRGRTYYRDQTIY